MEFSGNSLSLSEFSLSELSRNLQYSSQLLENNVSEEVIHVTEKHQTWRRASKHRCSADSALKSNKSVDISFFRKTNKVNGTMTLSRNFIAKNPVSKPSLNLPQGESEIIVKNICEDWVDLTESSKKKKGFFQKSKSLKNLVSPRLQPQDNATYFGSRKF